MKCALATGFFHSAKDGNREGRGGEGKGRGRGLKIEESARGW